MKKIFSTFALVTKILLVIVVLIIIGKTIDRYELIRVNFILAIFFLVCLGITGWLSFKTPFGEYPPKFFWLYVIVLITLLCIPAGILVNYLLQIGLVKKDGVTFTKKFYWFFEYE